MIGVGASLVVVTVVVVVGMWEEMDSFDEMIRQKAMAIFFF